MRTKCDFLTQTLKPIRINYLIYLPFSFLLNAESAVKQVLQVSFFSFAAALLMAATSVQAQEQSVKMHFTRDVRFGTQDTKGQRLSGTETMRILEHDGKLFASTGVWTDRPYFEVKDGRPWTGPQILIKDSAAAQWRVDRSFPRSIRVDGLYSAMFETAGSGMQLTPPVPLLIASPSNGIFTRSDKTGQWTRCRGPEDDRIGMRSFCTHIDRITKVQSLFGGSQNRGAIYRAVYDADAPGRLRWTPEAELTGTGRVMALTEADGVLYAACGIKNNLPRSGGLFRRIDGEKPHWEQILRWSYQLEAKGDEKTILRGLTAVVDPRGGKNSVLLGTCHYPGVVYRIDINRNFELSVELDIRSYFAEVFKVPELKGPCLSAYNDMPQTVDPVTGESVHLIGLWINAPVSSSREQRASAWYLIRSDNGTYRHGRVFTADEPQPNPPRGLLAVRTIAVSPFPEERSGVLFFGGYDCADIPSRDTAWIYRGTWLKRQ
ncbi:MAG: hypothetical protein FWE67_03900 [Planctomycetaceae bacterium]|nr:hypothetical protein [Planctomycetaceae bacterium]